LHNECKKQQLAEASRQNQKQAKSSSSEDKDKPTIPKLSNETVSSNLTKRQTQMNQK
jgi:hypothetical protein